MSVKVPASSSELFNEYLATCKSKVESKSTESYFHVNVVAEAYNKGFSDGKKLGKEEFLKHIVSDKIEEFVQKANQIYILSKNVISSLKEKGFEVDGLHINLTPNRPSVVISVPNELLNDDSFVEAAYTKIFENKNIFTKLFNALLDIGLVSSENLDETLLEDDGFGYMEKY